MTTILITLKAPLQSWGVTEAYEHRDTSPRPTKSGVIGLVARALGSERGSDMSDLSAMRFGTRTIRPGRILSDLQTMGVRADGKPNPLQHKDYLMDAAFLAGLETDDAQLAERIIQAFHHPVYAPYLGRRSCPPAGPIPITLDDRPLEEALAGKGDIWIEDPAEPDGITWDQPYGHREFGSRGLKHITCDEFLKAVEANQ